MDTATVIDADTVIGVGAGIGSSADTGADFCTTTPGAATGAEVLGGESL